MTKTVSINNPIEDDLAAMEYIAHTVGTTFGANGKIFHIYEDGFHRFSKDGITCLSQLTKHERPDVAKMATLLMQAAYTQLKEVGDGTTTAVILAYEMFKHLLVVKEEWGMSDRELKTWLFSNVQKVCDHIEANKLICDEVKIKKIAGISANNDTEIGNIIGGLVWQVGRYGTITVEKKEGSAEITTELRDGYFFETSARLPLNYKVVPMPNGKLDISDCWVLNTNINFNSMLGLNPIMSIMNYLVQLTGEIKPLVVICEDLHGEALGAIERTIEERGFDALPIVFIKAAHAQELRGDFLSDVQAICGGQLWDNRQNAWGTVDEVIRNNTFKIGNSARFTFHNGKGATIYGKAPKSYTDELQGKVDTEINPQVKSYYEERLGKLLSGIGVIYIGANVEGESSYRYDVVDDTWKAAKSALKRGCVYGGGSALYSAFKTVDSTDKYQTFHSVLYAPYRKLVGHDLIPHQKGVFNVITKKWEDTKDTTILDPADAPQVALKCAANVAYLLVTKSFTITHKIENEKHKSGYSSTNE